MSLIEIIGGVCIIIAAIAIIVSVALQEPKSGLGGALGGATNEGSFYDKSRTKTMDAQLSNISKLSGIALVVIALAVLAAKIYL